MAKRKDAIAPSHRSPAIASASSGKSTLTSSSAPPRVPATATGGTAARPPKPSPFRVVTLLFRIASLSFAIYVLYKKMYPSSSSRAADELDQFSRKSRSRIDSEPIKADHEKLDAIVEAFKVSQSGL